MKLEHSINRRDFLKSSLALAGGMSLGTIPILGAAASDNTLLMADPNEFIFSRFKYACSYSVREQWDWYPSADEFFLECLRRQTNIKVAPLTFEQRVVAVDDFTSLYKRPFLFMTGEGEFELSAAEAEAMGEHFRRGGFIWCDDCINNGQNDFFYRSCEREMLKAMPGYQWEKVTPDHPIYHCFFDIPGGRSPYHNKGRLNPDLGLFLNGRLVAFVTSTDIHCGWDGQWFGPKVQEECIQMGINIVIYSLTH